MCWSRMSIGNLSSRKTPKSRASKQFPVFDIESKRLSTLPLKEIQADALKEVKVPRFGLFDIYASNEDAIDSESNNENDDDEEEEEVGAWGPVRQPQSIRVVTRVSQDTAGMSFRARVNLGPVSAVKRVFSSRSRTLYVGVIPRVM